jgi:Spy/CpxP family protein refolding chaperone
MRINKASLVAALAVAGLLVGSTLAYAQANDGGEKKQGKRGFPTVEERLARIDEAVKLTDEQKPKVKAALEDVQKQMMEARNAAPEERRDKMQTIMADQDKKMKEILTPDQYEKYKAMPRPGRGGKKDGGEKKDGEKKE